MNTRASAPVYFEPYNVEIWSDPYAIYRRLREEAPVYYNDQHDFYACSRFEDVERGLMDKETFINGRGNVLAVIKANVQAPAGIFIMEYPPIHTAHRGAMTRLFTPKNLRLLEAENRNFFAHRYHPLTEPGERTDT